MSKFIILHGTDASPASNWFMWLKGVLIGAGHQVWLPQLPDSNTPSVVAYNRLLLHNPNFVIDSDTTLIGHSSGAVEILHILQTIPEDTAVRAAILVSAFKDNLGMDNLNGLFVEQFDFPKIRATCPRISFVHSDNDPYIPLTDATFLAEQTDGELIVFEGQGHFNTETDSRYKQFPELLEFIDYQIK